MRLAAVLPSTAIAHDTVMTKDWASAVEDLGFDRIVAEDHVLGADRDRRASLTGPYSYLHPFREPLTLFAYLAGVTRSLELMTGVLVLPQRQTALVAKQATEVDLLSGGRLVLGVGVGWNQVEYESMGVDFAARGSRLEEQVGVLRQLWAAPTVDATGRFHRIDRAGLLPRPQRPVPIWFGGASEPAVRRAARLGDGFFFAAMRESTISGVELLGKLLAQEQDGGLDPKRPFGLQVMVSALNGPEKFADDVRAWAGLSGTHVAVSTSAPSTERGSRDDGIEAHLARLAECAEIARSVVPSLSADRRAGDSIRG